MLYLEQCGLWIQIRLCYGSETMKGYVENIYSTL